MVENRSWAEAIREFHREQAELKRELDHELGRDRALEEIQREREAFGAKYGISIHHGGTIATQTASPPPKKPRGPQNVLRDLPDDPGERKNAPIGTGVLDYFPLALAEIARLSKAGNDQHNPGEPLNWARGKSNDHWDCITRHGIQRGTRDTDGMRHSAKLAWRALALLQEEIEADAGWAPEE